PPRAAQPSTATAEPRPLVDGGSGSLVVALPSSDHGPFVTNVTKKVTPARRGTSARMRNRLTTVGSRTLIGLAAGSVLLATGSVTGATAFRFLAVNSAKLSVSLSGPQKSSLVAKTTFELAPGADADPGDEGLTFSMGPFSQRLAPGALVRRSES